MKVKDIPELKHRILDILPITQSELWKTLKIDHRDASDIVGIMVKEHLIKKTKFDKTFMLEKEKPVDFSVLISGGKFVPCSGCTDECKPQYCKKLEEWVKEGVVEEENVENVKKEKKEKKIKEQQNKNIILLGKKKGKSLVERRVEIALNCN